MAGGGRTNDLQFWKHLLYKLCLSRHSSVDSSAPTILPPRVQVPSTPSMLFHLQYLCYIFHGKRMKLNKKRPGLAHFKKKERQGFLGVLPQLSGFICAYHPAAPGLSPKHTIYAFSFIVFVLYLSFEKNKNKQKEAGFGPFFLKKDRVSLLTYDTV